LGHFGNPLTEAALHGITRALASVGRAFEPRSFQSVVWPTGGGIAWSWALWSARATAAGTSGWASAGRVASYAEVRRSGSPVSLHHNGSIRRGRGLWLLLILVEAIGGNNAMRPGQQCANVSIFLDPTVRLFIWALQPKMRYKMSSVLNRSHWEATSAHLVRISEASCLPYPSQLGVELVLQYVMTICLITSAHFSWRLLRREQLMFSVSQACRDHDEATALRSLLCNRSQMGPVTAPLKAAMLRRHKTALFARWCLCPDTECNQVRDLNRELQHGERKGPEMLIILIIVLVLVFGGGGGYFGYSRWGAGGGAGIGLGTVLVILLVCYLLGVFR